MLLIVVIICNLVKTVCIGTALWFGDFGPLATIGDAITSFMTTPDRTTERLGPVSYHNIRSGAFVSGIILDQVSFGKLNEIHGIRLSAG